MGKIKLLAQARTQANHNQEQQGMLYCKGRGEQVTSRHRGALAAARTPSLLRDDHLWLLGRLLRAGSSRKQGHGVSGWG